MRRRSTKRGRPRGKNHSRSDIELLKYLAKISVKHKVDSKEFFQKLVDGWKNQESKCEHLTILCRKKTEDSVVLLVSNNRKVVAQFSIPTRILQEVSPLERFVAQIPIKTVIPKDAIVKIKDLEQAMKQVNLNARVLDVPDPKPVFTRFGTEAYVSNALIADETGTIRLSLWNQQINKVSVNDIIKIENAKVARFGGNRQLRLGRSGKLSVIEVSDFPTSDELKIAAAKFESE